MYEATYIDSDGVRIYKACSNCANRHEVTDKCLVKEPLRDCLTDEKHNQYVYWKPIKEEITFLTEDEMRI
jgi:hypothetical protein